MTPEQIARVAHAANAEYRVILGEESGPAWADLPEGWRAGIVAGVENARRDNRETPQQSHERWLISKHRDGWSYGLYDPVNKTHPNMVPFSQLPEEQRNKDALFQAIARAL